MSLEEKKAILRNGIETMNALKNLAITRMDEFISPNYVDHTNQLTLEGAKQFYTMIFKGFPDYNITAEDIIAEGEKVWVHSTTTMTHTGEFRGIAPTGKKITITGVNIYRMGEDGKMVEGWSVTDSLNLLKQLGLIEFTEKAKGILPEDVASRPSTSRENSKTEKQPSISLKENKAIIRSLYEADNERDWTILDELISPDFFEATLRLRGPEAYKQFVGAFFKGFPDWDETILDIAAEGEKVWVFIKGTGTHTGEFWGIAPTNEKMTIMMVQMWRVVDGKVVEKRSVADEMEVYKKAGLIKYTEKGKKLFPKEG